VRRSTDHVRGDIGPAVTFGITGNITTALYEHDSVLDGMSTSAIVAVLLCALGLMFFYRNGRLVLAILWALAAGVAATFAMAWATVGHLNVMTAFLFAIVVGNGINPGMLLSARYLDELRRNSDPRDALVKAISGAVAGTFAAMATSSVAYLSLLVTDFKGFRQFGAIAGFGMVLTWITTFTILPGILFIMARRGWIKATPPSVAGKVLAKTFSERHRLHVLGLGAALTAIYRRRSVHARLARSAVDQLRDRDDAPSQRDDPRQLRHEGLLDRSGVSGRDRGRPSRGCRAAREADPHGRRGTPGISALAARRAQHRRSSPGRSGREARGARRHPAAHRRCGAASDALRRGQGAPRESASA
jgi:predicted exporter